MAKKGNIFKRMGGFISEVRGELKKVTWPTKNDLYKTTIAVLVSSVIFGVYLFIVDFSFSELFNKIIGLLSK